MAIKKRAKKTSDRHKFFFKSFGEGLSAVLRVNDDGSLDACQTTERGGKLVKPYKWGCALPAGSIETDDRIDIIMLGEGFADVYAVTPLGKISTRRIGLRGSEWVSAKEWTVVHDHIAKTPDKVEPTPPPVDEALPETDEVRKEAMRKRGVMLEQHATAGK